MSGGMARRLLALAAGALLAGCASSQQASEDTSPAAPSAPVAAAPASEAPAPAPPVATPTEDAVPAAGAVRKPPTPARNGVVLSAAARAATGASATPRQLIGLEGEDVQALLGQPFLLKREAAAELWQYRAPSCVLDVFLYAGKDGGQRVTHAELRARRENARPPAGCYAQILNAPRLSTPQQTAKG